MSRNQITPFHLAITVDDIEAELYQLGRAEVSAQLIGEATIAKLRELDRVAYIRYASVYRDFDDLDEFQREIEAIQTAMREGQRTPAASQLALIPDQVGAPLAKPRARRGRKPRMSPPPAQQPTG